MPDPSSSLLSDLRDRLDSADRALIDLLAKRERLVNDMASLKAETPDLPLHDPGRETSLLRRVRALAGEVGIDGYFAETLFRRILDHSVRVQAAQQTGPKRLRVAYQGEDGCYSHGAAQRHLTGRKAVGFVGCTTFRDTVEMLRRGEVDLAVLPIENTVAGPIDDTYDLIAERGLKLVGEEVIPVEHCLLAPEPVALGRIRRVSSHPKALAQCSQFLASLTDCRVAAEHDTAGAARMVVESGDLSRAAIAGEDAAVRYGLHVIQRNIANRKDNFTRFVVVAREAQAHDTRLPHKTSLLLTTNHRQGALAEVLQVLARHGLNLTKLESRPSAEGPWRYRFYLDVEGGAHEPDVQAALDEVTHHATSVRVLGSYPQAGAASAEGRAAPAAETATKTEEAEVVSRAVSGPMIPSSGRYRLVSREHRPEDTVVEIGGVRVGGGGPPVMIAGPCSVEGRNQILESAQAVRAAGGRMLRGGCFKPRTSPYSFQGLGFEGLSMLAEAGRAYDLPIVTEVLDSSDVEAVAREADVLQIGARNMQNFELLKAVGRTQSPVLLKRGMMASIEEWLAAAEYVLAQGNERVMLCERGIRTFETATRYTLDLSSVVVARERTHLPIIVDPSHAAGARRWVPALTRAALAAGAHGVIVEVHPRPEEALSDGPQSITPEALSDLGRGLFITGSPHATDGRHATGRPAAA